MSWKGRDYLCLVYKCQSDSSLLDREILSEYWSNRILLISLKTWFGSRFFQVAKCLLTNSMVSLFVGTYLREEFRNNIEWVGKSVISCVFNARGKVTALLWAEKIPPEYWSNIILLMSFRIQFNSLFLQVAQSSSTNFYCFNIHGFTSPRKGEIPEQFRVC